MFFFGKHKASLGLDPFYFDDCFQLKCQIVTSFDLYLCFYCTISIVKIHIYE